ncbi:tRNA pseudouridine(55) synthase TruB [Microlunatus elymi]|uniref:tRNA pseudouridine synthase B n=1 Tax=Microlunatus elymi TaxID=2596828 RepID=A0A516PYN9_9ACTN|nr:tRNA pseudouridine(55) synthase TruB [Microlunatus elymi]QDP96287.1 tRNA pseudouridine(55) synthase TruB [Microlunatus elymi]
MSPDPTSAAPSGVVIADKPVGLTSHQVVGRLRRLAHTRKVGHAGTLDPMATGVLVIGIERATRLLGHLALTEKEYLATIRLGVATVTDDAEGDVTERRGAAELDEQQLTAAMRRLTGTIDQVPSSVSAIKINGVRSYARVRAGDQVELAARPVTVSAFDLLQRRDVEVDGLPVVDLDVRVGCSSGTYIRALARDLGTRLGTGGHLTSLRRTKVGTFGVEEARTLEQLEDDLGLLDLETVARRTFPTLELDEQQAAWVRNGRRLPGLDLPGEPTAVFSPAGEFLALYRPSGQDAVAEAVFALAASAGEGPRD